MTLPSFAIQRLRDVIGIGDGELLAAGGGFEVNGSGVEDVDGEATRGAEKF